MNFPLSRCLLIAAASVLVLTSSPAQAGTVSNLTDWDGTSSEFDWGAVGDETPTYGESFQATTTNAVLNSVTFEIRNDGTVPINFVAQVGAWDGQEVTGPILFDSDPAVVPTGSGFQAITVSTGNLGLTAGTEYVVYYTTIGQTSGADTDADWGLLDTTPISNSLAQYNNASTADGLSQPWDGSDFTSGSGQFAFSMQFAAPEPSTWAMMIGGIGLLVGWQRFRRMAVA